MQPTDPGRDAMHRCSASAAFPLTLLLLTALLSGAAVLPWASAMAETAEPKWIPPYSSDLENLVRQIEEGRASGEDDSQGRQVQVFRRGQFSLATAGDEPCAGAVMGDFLVGHHLP